MTLYKAMSAVKRRELEAEVERAHSEVERLLVVETDLTKEVERLREVIHQHVATELKLSAMTVELEEKIARLQAENAEALRYVTSLCRSWFPSIEPLSDLNGVISQLDNGVCGTRAENAELREALKNAQQFNRELAKRAEGLTRYVESFGGDAEAIAAGAGE